MSRLIELLPMAISFWILSPAASLPITSPPTRNQRFSSRAPTVLAVASGWSSCRSDCASRQYSRPIAGRRKKMTDHQTKYAQSSALRMPDTAMATISFRSNYEKILKRSKIICFNEKYFTSINRQSDRRFLQVHATILECLVLEIRSPANLSAAPASRTAPGLASRAITLMPRTSLAHCRWDHIIYSKDQRCEDLELSGMY